MPEIITKNWLFGRFKKKPDVSVVTTSEPNSLSVQAPVREIVPAHTLETSNIPEEVPINPPVVDFLGVQENRLESLTMESSDQPTYHDLLGSLSHNEIGVETSEFSATAQLPTREDLIHSLNHGSNGTSLQETTLGDAAMPSRNDLLAQLSGNEVKAADGTSQLNMPSTSDLLSALSSPKVIEGGNGIVVAPDDETDRGGTLSPDGQLLFEVLQRFLSESVSGHEDEVKQNLIRSQDELQTIIEQRRATSDDKDGEIVNLDVKLEQLINQLLPSDPQRVEGGDNRYEKGLVVDEFWTLALRNEPQKKPTVLRVQGNEDKQPKVAQDGSIAGVGKDENREELGGDLGEDHGKAAIGNLKLSAPTTLTQEAEKTELTVDQVAGWLADEMGVKFQSLYPDADFQVLVSDEHNSSGMNQQIAEAVKLAQTPGSETKVRECLVVAGTYLVAAANSKDYAEELTKMEDQLLALSNLTTVNSLAQDQVGALSLPYRITDADNLILEQVAQVVADRMLAPSQVFPTQPMTSTEVIPPESGTNRVYQAENLPIAGAVTVLSKKQEELRKLESARKVYQSSRQRSPELEDMLNRIPELKQEIKELERQQKGNSQVAQSETGGAEQPNKPARVPFLKRMRGWFAGGQGWFQDYMGEKQRARKRLVDQGQAESTQTEETLITEMGNENMTVRIRKELLAAVAGLGTGLSLTALNAWLMSKGYSPDVITGIRYGLQVVPLALAGLMPGGEMFRKWGAQMGVKASQRSEVESQSNAVQSKAGKACSDIGDLLLSLGERSAQSLSRNPNLLRAYFFGLGAPALAGAVNSLLEGAGVDVGHMTQNVVAGIHHTYDEVVEFPREVAVGVHEVGDIIGRLHDNPQVMQQLGELIDTAQTEAQLPGEITKRIDAFQANHGLQANVGNHTDRQTNWHWGQGMGPSEKTGADNGATNPSASVSENTHTTFIPTVEVGHPVPSEYQPSIIFNEDAASEWKNNPVDPTQRAVIDSMAGLHHDLFNPDGTVNQVQIDAFRTHFNIPPTTPVTEQTLRDYGTAIHFSGAGEWENLSLEGFTQQQSNNSIFLEDGHTKFKLTEPPAGKNIFVEQ